MNRVISTGHLLQRYHIEIDEIYLKIAALVFFDNYMKQITKLPLKVFYLHPLLSLYKTSYSFYSKIEFWEFFRSYISISLLQNLKMRFFYILQFCNKLERFKSDVIQKFKYLKILISDKLVNIWRVLFYNFVIFVFCVKIQGAKKRHYHTCCFC